MSTNLVAILGFAGLFVLMLLRVPVGIAMGTVGVLGYASITGWGPALAILTHSPTRVVTEPSFALVPMFVLMGVFATATGLSRELFRAGEAWVGRYRGGMAMATVLSCGGFAAICGSSVATAATMTKVALPELRRAGYSPAVGTGVIAAGGTLGILIPPSVILAIYGFITQQDIGELFIAGVIPGLLAIVMHLVTVQIIGAVRPEAMPRSPDLGWRARWKTLSGTWAVLLLFVAIILGIYFGIVTPTEAAAGGAALTFLIGVVRRRLTPRLTVDCLIEALRTSVAIFTILMGAFLFGYFLTITQTPQKVTQFLVGLDMGPYGVLLLILLFALILGCILDAMAMIVLLVPIIFPVIMALDLGLPPWEVGIWFGIIVVMTVELGLITPPIGMNVFVINSVARNVGLPTIFKGVLPFVATDITRLGLLILFPWLSLALVRAM